MDDIALVGGGGAHGLEIGGGEREMLAVEADDDAAEGFGVGAEREGVVSAAVVGS